MMMKKTYSKPALVKEQKLTSITAAPISSKAPPPWSRPVSSGPD